MAAHPGDVRGNEGEAPKSSDAVFNRIIPLDLDWDGEPSLEECHALYAHAAKLPDIVRDMEEAVCREAAMACDISVHDALRAFNDNLLIVAGRLVVNNQAFLKNVGVRLMAIAVRKGADAKWAERILDNYEESIMHGIEQRKTEAERVDFIKYLTPDFFLAAATLLPRSDIARRLHEKVGLFLDCVFRDAGLGEYRMLLFPRILKACEEPGKYPGAGILLGQSYIRIADQMEEGLDEPPHPRGLKARLRDLQNMAALDMTMVFYFHGTAPFAERAAYEFTDHWKALAAIDPELAKSFLAKMPPTDPRLLLKTLHPTQTGAPKDAIIVDPGLRKGWELFDECVPDMDYVARPFKPKWPHMPYVQELMASVSHYCLSWRIAALSSGNPQTPSVNDAQHRCCFHGRLNRPSP